MRRKRLNRPRSDGFVGILAADIHFPESGSLKDKRQILRSLKAGLARKLGASVAETGFHDQWQHSRLLLSLSSTSAAEAERALDLALRLIEQRDQPVFAVYRQIIKIEGE